MSRRNDWIGKKFKHLTVVEYVGNSRWKCRCDCGRETEVSTTNLSNGHVTSCGCARGLGIIGRKMGKLTVIDKTEEESFYYCRCDCGNYCIRRYETLMSTRESMCDECAKEIRADGIRHSSTFVGGTQPCKLDSKPTKANKSGVVGVNWDKSRNKWQASIRFQGHKYNLGRFDNFADAVEIRRQAEKEIFGKFLEWYAEHKQEESGKP